MSGEGRRGGEGRGGEGRRKGEGGEGRGGGGGRPWRDFAARAGRGIVTFPPMEFLHLSPSMVRNTRSRLIPVARQREDEAHHALTGGRAQRRRASRQI